MVGVVTAATSTKFFNIKHSRPVFSNSQYLIFLINTKNRDCFPIQHSLGFSILEIFKVYCEVGSNILCIIHMHYRLRGVNDLIVDKNN